MTGFTALWAAGSIAGWQSWLVCSYSYLTIAAHQATASVVVVVDVFVFVVV